MHRKFIITDKLADTNLDQAPLRQKSINSENFWIETLELNEQLIR